MPNLRKRQTAYPNDKSAWLVRRTNLVVRAFRDMVEEELEQVLRLLVFEPDDAAREAWVDVQRLLAGDGVLAHDRVLARQRINQCTGE